nr:alkaline phosphatase synthesis transcriptional regulatory protein PhoP [uncultured bacterium]
MEATNAGRVLVVDDDKHAVEILYRLLEREGFEVLRAQSGKEALATVATADVDVILLDVMMPEMDGFQVCEALRAADRTRDIPVILLTAKDDMETRVLGMKLGVSEFLTKPINKRELFARIRAQLHQRGLEHGIISLVDRVG